MSNNTPSHDSSSSDEESEGELMEIEIIAGGGEPTEEDMVLVRAWRKRSFYAQERDENALLPKMKKKRGEATVDEFLKLPDLGKQLQITVDELDEFKKEVTKALDPLAVEKELNGKLLAYGKKAYDYKFLKYYSHDASTFRTRSQLAEQGRETQRPPAEFRAFLGPSGSGKTYSAIKTPFVGLSKFNCHEYYCTLYTTVVSVWDPDSKKSLIDGVEKAWLEKLPQCKKPLAMVVHVVIDEAGFAEAKEHFKWSISEITALQARLKKYAKTVLITAAGTNLDAVLSKTVNTTCADLLKYRPGPWGLENILGLVPGISKHYKLAKETPEPEKKEKIGEWVKKVPVFGALAANGRAAVKLIQALLRLLSSLRDALDNIPGVVDSVSKSYIQENGLRDLTALERRKVVKAVMNAVGQPDTDTPTPVQFVDIEPRLEPHCYGLVESNIEKDGNEYIFIDDDWKCPCKVSACLTIVMFDLLGFASKLSSNWESFETVCILSLIQEAVKAMDVKDEIRLIQMKAPFPAESAVYYEAQVPLTGKQDVVLNGPKAPHGDGFGNYTIVQSKHALKYGEVKCKLREELYKAGLRKGDDDEREGGASVHAAITALLYRQWSGDNLDPESSMISPRDREKPTRNIMYPASLLESDRPVNYKVIPIKKVKKKWTFGDDGAELTVPAEFPPNPENSIAEPVSGECEEPATAESMPGKNITFAICTNGSSIKLDLESEKYEMTDLDDYSLSASAAPNEFIVMPFDVDMIGALMDTVNTRPLRDWIARMTKPGVTVHFRFCRGV